MTETAVVIVQKHDDVPYISVAQAFAMNGKRHQENAMRHLREGRINWAIGSLRKAVRNLERAKLLSAGQL